MGIDAIAPYHRALKNGETTVVATVSDFLARISDTAHLNAFLEVFVDDAMQRAKTLDASIAEGQFGKLTGVVIAIKDNICFEGHRVQAASKILEGFESLYSATVIERLLAEGAVIIGRLNCDEFAMGSSTENSSLGNTLNPWDNTRVPGGSSGGSAAAVAAGLCHVALGSDTGGSIRQPASFCGVVGVKPTYGRVSRYGLLAYASSFDQIGPLARNVDDAALILEVMAGADDYDSTASSRPVPRYSEELTASGKKRFAYLRDCVEHPALDADIRDRFMKMVEGLRNEGHTVQAVDFPLLEHLVPTYYVLTTAEASSNFSRYDGMRYGYRSPKAHDLESTYKMSRSEGFGPEVKRRIMLGTFVLSAGYYDAYYSKGQKVRRLVQDRVKAIFDDHDLMLSPTTPDVAFRFGENSDDPIKMYLEDIFTVLANLAGIPAISVPLGEKDGLPFGVQVMADSFHESEMLAYGKRLLSDDFGVLV
ncbi:MAG: Asp-tRNA(Asn)/Glu-tRNA(Gln) amidotransferase subunit GatA [Flavobacteriales bacterium]|nr:Asp-tRNA(Asn)/Glu-tRNA(Gln) amidotransferase subunit GatA [Flavobacteriales bacterium]